MPVPDILTNPLCRPRSWYDYKVLAVSGNTVAIDALDGSRRTIKFDNVEPTKFEEDYKGQIKDLYVGINMDGKCSLFTKEQVTTNWKHEK
jgi:hypothetical protein